MKKAKKKAAKKAVRSPKRKIKLFYFDKGDGEAALQKQVDAWLSKSSARIISVDSSISVRSEGCSEILMTVVYK